MENDGSNDFKKINFNISFLEVLFLNGIKWY